MYTQYYYYNQTSIKMLEERRLCTAARDESHCLLVLLEKEPKPKICIYIDSSSLQRQHYKNIITIKINITNTANLFID